MSRLFSILVLTSWLAIVWGVLVWRTGPPAPDAPPPMRTLSWNDFFVNHILGTLPVAGSFETPLRPPRGEGVSVARPFEDVSAKLPKGAEHHLGEDWNTAEGDKDLGEPVYSPADGWVSMASDLQSMWGGVVMVVYRLPAGSTPPAVEMLFAHLSRIDVKPMMIVKKGQALGLMGNAGGVYKAHLHWEVRNILGLGLGGGFANDTTGWSGPTLFLQSRHPELSMFFLGKNLPEPAWTAWGSD